MILMETAKYFGKKENEKRVYTGVPPLPLYSKVIFQRLRNC